MIKIVFHHGELVNVYQSEVTEASGVSIAWIILFMYLVKWVTFVLISGIYIQHCIWIMTQVPPCEAIRISKVNLFCKTTFLICICLALRAELAFWESCKACWVKLVRVSTLYSIISVVPREGVNILKYRPCPMRFKVWQISSLLWKLWKY